MLLTEEQLAILFYIAGSLQTGVLKRSLLQSVSREVTKGLRADPLHINVIAYLYLNFGLSLWEIFTLLQSYESVLIATLKVTFFLLV